PTQIGTSLGVGRRVVVEDLWALHLSQLRMGRQAVSPASGLTTGYSNCGFDYSRSICPSRMTVAITPPRSTFEIAGCLHRVVTSWAVCRTIWPLLAQRPMDATQC